jgi:hypothetical protein
MYLSLIITSSLHYLALIPILIKYRNKSMSDFTKLYRNTIIFSTTFSIFWHYFDQSYILFYFDYIIALLWFCQDILWSLIVNKPIIIYLNIIIFLLNFLVRYSGNYVLYHSIWHVISSIKCIYISSIIK